MIKGQKSVRNGVEDFLCPFTDMYITQLSGVGTHKGTCAIDVRGKQVGVRYPYYAPCTVKCMKTYPSYGQAMWQSVNNVRCPNGYVGKVTFMTVHDDSFDAEVGMVVPQGNQLGNMGTKGYATGVHCHIECSQSATTSWVKNKYGIYCFPTESYLDDTCFVDNTNIIYGDGGNWRTTGQVPEDTRNYINIPPTIEARNVYNMKQQVVGQIKPKKFGGLSYYVYRYVGDFAEIQTANFGRVLVKKTASTPITIGKHTYNRGSF